MNVENLIVCGCSFTEGHHLSIQETWGAFVAKKQNWNLHNIAHGGMGNEWIAQRTMAYIENNSELKSNSIVMIAWSEVSRLMGTFQYSSNEKVSIETIRPADFIDDGQKDHWTRNITQYHGYALQYADTLLPFFSSYSYCFFKSYLALHTLKTYLTYNKIPYIFFDAISDIKLIDLKRTQNDKLHELICNDSYGKPMSFIESIPNDCLNYLNKNFESNLFDERYINFNGNSMLVEMRNTKYDYFTEGNSGHPNLNACDYFSEMIIEKYNRLYF